MTNDSKIIINDQVLLGKLCVTKKVIKKVIYQAISGENYEIANIIITNDKNTNNLTALIKIDIDQQNNLSKVKTKVISKILKHISHVININNISINLLLTANRTING